jgi:glycosyltransferase involved in cell wall biosynthesis
MTEIPRTLFAGIGTSAVCWYRAALPAIALGADWVGVRSAPPDLRIVTGDVGRVSGVESFASYDIVVLQQVRGRGWMNVIQQLRAGGTRVLYEIDDLPDAIRKTEDHDQALAIDREWVRDVELAMRVCDGAICSTDFLARRYRSLVPTTFTCRNGLDLRRYAVTRVPSADTVTIGWAGGTGHRRAMGAWLPAIAKVLRERPETRFMTVGEPFASELADEFGEERCIAVPFSNLETYPAAMANFDIALAPAAPTNFFRAKSDLRWLEASALGIPVIADPEVYPDVEDGVTGFHAATPDEAGSLLRALVSDPGLRSRVGAAAREHVAATRRIELMAEQWRTALTAVVAAPVAA